MSTVTKSDLPLLVRISWIFIIMMINLTSHETIWVIDVNASTHITSLERQFFTSYMLDNFVYVKIRNDDEGKVTGTEFYLIISHHPIKRT